MLWSHRIILAVLFFTLVTGTVSANEFTDVTATYKHHDAIATISDNGIVQGYANGQFKPGNTINRAEAVKILIAANFDAMETRQSVAWHWAKRHRYVWFPDVKISEWYAPYVEVAHNEQIVQGDPNNNFRPADPINFAEG